MKAMTEATKLVPIADSAINLTALFPRRFPQMPFTAAPRSGMPRMTAMSE
jgi:hypothetical protein